MMIDEKPQRRWCVANSIYGRGEGIQAFESSCSHPPMDEGYDGVGLIFSRHDLQKLTGF